MATENALFGGGCFWCTEAVFQRLKGVVSVVSGYAGGTTKNPTYADVSGGKTGHAEVVQVTFNPAVIRYRDLLEVFFATHDPTTPNQQGADAGPQYRSVIVAANKSQQHEARTIIQELTAAHAFHNPIVTEIITNMTFYPADVSHQNYYNTNAAQPYCTFVIAPKLKKFKDKFASLLKAEA